MFLQHYLLFLLLFLAAADLYRLSTNAQGGTYTPQDNVQPQQEQQGY